MKFPDAEPVGRGATPEEQAELDYAVFLARKRTRFVNLRGDREARAATVVRTQHGTRGLEVDRGFVVHPDDRGGLARR